MEPTADEFPDRVRELADRCVEAVQRAHAFTMDYSEESLAMLDHYVTAVPEDKREVIDLVAPLVGAYFGEVARRRLGGRWKTPGLEPSSWSIELAAVPLSFSPLGMAAEAIVEGELPGYDSAVRTGSMEEPVRQMLEVAPPLPEDQFYSLTGRLEALEQIADFMHELARQSGEDADDDEDEADSDADKADGGDVN